MSKNPFKGLADFYKKCVDEADEAGFAEVYKQSTDLLFTRIKEELKLDLHFEDIQYLDGYFIFGHGTNSVVHFHIKEAPGWLGGIWWSPVATKETENKKKKVYRTDILNCNLFFQYEEEIDKFKPSASTFGGKDFNFYLDDTDCFNEFWDTCQELKFIIDEPYLAFYREMHYVNFNHEYISREKAKRYWDSHWKKKAKEKEVAKLNAQTMFEAVKTILKPAVEDGDAFIYDRGDCWSPRYEIVIKNPILEDGKPWIEKDGCYYLFDLGYGDNKSDEKLYKKAEKECAKRSSYHMYFGNPFSPHCEVRENKLFNKWLKEGIKESTLLYYKKEDGTIYEGEVQSS